jgi:hypothetical protein
MTLIARKPVLDGVLEDRSAAVPSLYRPCWISAPKLRLRNARPAVMGTPLTPSTRSPVTQHDASSFPNWSMAMLWAPCLLPLLLFGAFAGYERAQALRNGELTIARTIKILEEHALRVFEAQQLIIDQTDQYLGNMT